MKPFTFLADTSMAFLKGLVVVALSSSAAHAYTFDWTGWGAGNLTHTYTDVGGSGVDVVVNVTGNTGALQVNYPQFDNIGPTGDSLNLRLSYGSDPIKSVTTTINFYATGTTTPVGVSLVDMTAMDIDSTLGGQNYQDRVTYSAVPFGGGSVDPNTITTYSTPNPTFVNVDPPNRVYSDPDIGNQSQTDDRTWATVNYDTNPVIESMSIIYDNHPDVTGNTTTQYIWYSGFDFFPVELGITKTSNAIGLVQPRDTITYTINVENTGKATHENMVVLDPLPTGTTYVAQSTVASAPVPGATETYLDEFGSASYSNSNGTQTWSTSWVEGGGETGQDPSARNIQVTGGSLSFDGDRDGSDLNTTPYWVQRAVDLSGATGTVTLTLSVTENGSLESDDRIQIDISGDGGTSWRNLLDQNNDFPPINVSEDVTAEAGANTLLRITATRYDGGTESLDIDDVQFSYNVPVVLTKDNIPGGVNADLASGIPPNLVLAADGFDLTPGDVLTITFQVAVDFPIPDGQTTISNTASATSDQQPSPVEDTVVDDLDPTVVTIGKVELDVISVSAFLSGIGVEQMDAEALLNLLESWDADLAATITGTNLDALLQALFDYLDPDGDGQVAVFRWETLEERGTIGFYVERRQDDSDWININDEMLPGLITAPMGGEYQLADPSAQAGESYLYQLIEQEARGSTRTYGPYSVEMSE